MANKNTVTIDLNGLNLNDAEFKAVQDAVHRTVLTEVAKLPTFPIGIGIKPFPIGDDFPLGIILDRLKNQNFGN